MKHITKQTLPMILLIGIIFTISTQAATYTVNDTNDAGDGTCDATCTLRDAVDDANGTADDDIIEFASPLFDTSQTITLTSGELVINNNGTLTINGTGADKLAVSGNNASRVFLINSNANVTLDGLTIRDGLTSNGAGGGISNQGVLTIKNSVITNNDARPNGGTGGGILNGAGRSITITNSTVSNNIARSGGGITNDSQAHLTVTNVTISGNTATSLGGGLYNNSGTANLTNSTISGNSTQFGGGLYQQTGTVNLTNVTISNNSAQLGGGIINDGTTNLTNTIIANSTSGGECENSGTINATHSLIENAFVCVNGNNSNYLMDDPLLAPLGNYGGPTQTHALLPGSPAIDTGDPNNFPQFDQRGNVRPADGNPISSSKANTKKRNLLGLLPDIGAFEALAPTAAGASISGKVLSPNGRGVPNAIVHITDQNGDVRTARSNHFGYYKIENIVVGQTLILNVHSRYYQYITQVINFYDVLSNFDFFPQGFEGKSFDKKENK